MKGFVVVLLSLFILWVDGLMSYEILSKLASLAQVEVKVEVFSLFPELPQSTYAYHQVPSTIVPLSTVLINYLPSNLSLTSGKYWEIMGFLNQGTKDFSNFPKLDWNTFQVFLIHSTNHTLFRNFRFAAEDDCCELIRFPFKTHFKRTFIESHPLEKVGIQEIHAVFTQALKSSSFFEWVSLYNGLLNKTIEDLRPIIVRCK